jgi:hypothetical protein
MASKDPKELIDEFVDGESAGDDASALSAWLREDRSHIDEFVQQAFLHQQLKESLSAESTASTPPIAPEASEETQRKPIVFPNRFFGFGSGVSSILFSVLVVCGVLGVAAVAYRIGRESTLRDRAVVQEQQEATPRVEEAKPYTARLVKVTNCLWASSGNDLRPKQDSPIDPGESLNLLEGVAEIKTVSPEGAVGKLILEGPASLMLSSQGVPSLQNGRLSVSIDDLSDFKALNTTLGSVIASHNASFGVASSGNRIEIHVFSGDIAFDAPLYLAGDSEASRKATTGEALVLSLSPQGAITVERGIAKEGSFITSTSLSASHLNITDKYVAAVKRSKPLAYWRFERVESGCIPNEMGDNFACQVRGPIRWKMNPSGNRSAEFGLLTQPGLLIVEDAFKNFDHGLSIEFWVKPAYYQGASIVSLDRFSENGSELPLQGVMVELTGPTTRGFPLPEYRFRFLHRSPPGSDINKGVSCFSEQWYQPRRWQHVAVVKDGEDMRLFVDGKTVAQGQDSAKTAENLRVLIGQLYPFTGGPDAGVRTFAGELDEVAIYDHPLTEREISQHVDLVRQDSSDLKTF